MFVYIYIYIHTYCHIYTHILYRSCKANCVAFIAACKLFKAQMEHVISELHCWCRKSSATATNDLSGGTINAGLTSL